MKRIKILFAWYDLWIGIFWDSKKKLLYILPIPMFGIIINFGKHKPICKECGGEAVDEIHCYNPDCKLFLY